jgi:hypothetical protein
LHPEKLKVWTPFIWAVIGLKMFLSMKNDWGLTCLAKLRNLTGLRRPPSCGSFVRKGRCSQHDSHGKCGQACYQTVISMRRVLKVFFSINRPSIKNGILSHMCKIGWLQQGGTAFSWLGLLKLGSG